MKQNTSNIKDNPFLYKDNKSKAIINGNIQGYRAAKLRKKRYHENLELKQEVKDLKQRLIMMENLIFKSHKNI